MAVFKPDETFHIFPDLFQIGLSRDGLQRFIMSALDTDFKLQQALWCFCNYLKELIVQKIPRDLKMKIRGALFSTR